MTAKEKLRHVIDGLTEAEAADMLDVLAHRSRSCDQLDELLAEAPVDDEPTAPDEDEGAREARAQIKRGEVFSSAQIKREIA